MKLRKFKRKILKISLWIFFGILLLELMLRSGSALYLTLKGPNEFETQSTFRIFCLGESTTACGSEFSWPSQLETILNEHIPGKKFKVINGAIPATNTAFLLSRLVDNINKYSPHIVITMMGLNDGNMRIRYEDNFSTKFYLFCTGLRTYKLGNMIWQGLNRRIQKQSKVDLPNNEMADPFHSQNKVDESEGDIDENLHSRLEEGRRSYELGASYRSQGRFKKAEELLVKSTRINPKHDSSYKELGNIYADQNRYQEAEEMFKKAIQLNPYYEGAYTELGDYYLDQGMVQEAEEAFTRALHLMPDNDRANSELVWIYQSMNLPDDEINKKLGEKGFSFEIQKGGDSKSITRYHFQLLYRIVSRRGIRLIVMQYPLRHIRDMKEMFQGYEDILFVSNRENFLEALEEADFEDIFSDRCYYDFGHGTAKGNRLIAQNLAHAIERELNKNR